MAAGTASRAGRSDQGAPGREGGVPWRPRVALRVPVGPSLLRPPRLLFVVTRQWPPRSSRDSFRRCGARRRVEHAAADADHTSCGRLRGSPSSWKSNGESQRGRKRTCPSHSPSTLHSARRIKSSIACPTGATDLEDPWHRLSCCNSIECVLRERRDIVRDDDATLVGGPLEN